MAVSQSSLSCVFMLCASLSRVANMSLALLNEATSRSVSASCSNSLMAKYRVWNLCITSGFCSICSFNRLIHSSSLGPWLMCMCLETLLCGRASVVAKSSWCSVGTSFLYSSCHFCRSAATSGLMLPSLSIKSIPSYMLMMMWKSSCTPRPVLNTVGIMGTPNCLPSISRSMVSPRFSNSSYMFRAHTMRKFMSTSWVVR